MVLVLGNSADVYCAVAQAQSLSQVKSSFLCQEDQVKKIKFLLYIRQCYEVKISTSTCVYTLQ